MNQVVAGNNFLGGIRRKGVYTGQINYREIRMAKNLSGLFLNRYAGEIAYMLIASS